MPCGVGEEVVEHLHDAPPVGHHRRKVRRQVDGDGVPPSPARERRACPLDEGADLLGPGVHEERARADARRVHQVGDQPVHAVGLLLDDAQELAQLRPVGVARVPQCRRRRALDGRERPPEFVAHQSQELRAGALQRLERGQILDRHHDRLDRALRRADRGRVKQGPDAPPVGHGELDLLGPHRLRAGEIGERDLAPVAAPARHRLRQPLDGTARREQPGHDALRLPVEGRRRTGGGVEHHDADGRGLDQRLQIGTGAPLVAVGEGVGDGRSRLLREQHHHGLVPVREPALLLPKVEAAHGCAPVTHRRPHQGPAGDRDRRAAERAGVVCKVRESSRRREQAFKDPEPVGPRGQRLVFLRRDAGGDEVEGAVRNGWGVDRAVAGTGERAGTVGGLAKHVVEVEARADA